MFVLHLIGCCFFLSLCVWTFKLALAIRNHVVGKQLTSITSFSRLAVSWRDDPLHLHSLPYLLLALNWLFFCCALIFRNLFLFFFFFFFRYYFATFYSFCIFLQEMISFICIALQGMIISSLNVQWLTVLKVTVGSYWVHIEFIIDL